LDPKVGARTKREAKPLPDDYWTFEVVDWLRWDESTILDQREDWLRKMLLIRSIKNEVLAEIAEKGDSGSRMSIAEMMQTIHEGG
jgi:hypothetical protein